MYTQGTRGGCPATGSNADMAAAAAGGSQFLQHYGSGAYQTTNNPTAGACAGSRRGPRAGSSSGQHAAGARGAAAAASYGYGAAGASAWGEHGMPLEGYGTAMNVMAAAADSMEGACRPEDMGWEEDGASAPQYMSNHQQGQGQQHGRRGRAGIASGSGGRGGGTSGGFIGHDGPAGGTSPAGRAFSRLEAVAAIAAAELQASSSSGSHADAAETAAAAAASMEHRACADMQRPPYRQQQHSAHELCAGPSMGGLECLQAAVQGALAGTEDCGITDAAAAAAAGADPSGAAWAMQELTTQQQTAQAASDLAPGGDGFDPDQAATGEQHGRAHHAALDNQSYIHMQEQLELLALHAGLDPAAAAAAAAAAAEAAQLHDRAAQGALTYQSRPHAPEQQAQDYLQESMQQQQQQYDAKQWLQAPDLYTRDASYGGTGGEGARCDSKSKRRRRWSHGHVPDEPATDSEEPEDQYDGSGAGCMDAAGYGAAEVLESLQGQQPQHGPHHDAGQGSGRGRESSPAQGPASGNAARVLTQHLGTASPSVSAGSKRGLESRSPHYKQALGAAAAAAAGWDGRPPLGEGQGVLALLQPQPHSRAAPAGHKSHDLTDVAAAAAAAGDSLAGLMPEALAALRQHHALTKAVRSSSGGGSSASRGLLPQIQRQHASGSEWGLAAMDGAGSSKWQQQQQQQHYQHRLSDTDTGTCLATQGSSGGAGLVAGPEPWPMPAAAARHDGQGNRRIPAGSGNDPSRLHGAALPGKSAEPDALAFDLLRRSSNDSNSMAPQQLSVAAAYISNVLESAVCATVLKALPQVLAGFSQCLAQTLAAAIQEQQQQYGGTSDGQQQQQLLLGAAAEELLKSLQAACQKAIAAEAVSDIMQNGSVEQQPPLPGGAVAALSAAAEAAGAMDQQELASAAMAAAKAGLVNADHSSVLEAAARAAVMVAAGNTAAAAAPVGAAGAAARDHCHDSPPEAAPSVQQRHSTEDFADAPMQEAELFAGQQDPCDRGLSTAYTEAQGAPRGALAVSCAAGQPAAALVDQQQQQQQHCL